VEDATLDVVRYMVMNPIRAGLCTDVREYSYLGSATFSIDELITTIPLA
jgi:hypothetical protein